MLDLNDTIAAVSVPPSGAARGILRISGPRALEIAANCFESAEAKSLSQNRRGLAHFAESSEQNVPVSLSADGSVIGPKPFGNLTRSAIVTGSLGIALRDRKQSKLPCDAYVWLGTASYTRQPTVELHTLGSLPLLQAVLRSLCDRGARLAEPGEFTLRAFLAGRLDLTQAEAVLGVIDARGDTALQTALQQLAGGLSQPLATLRTSLIELLADLEAGLDFVEEDIEFISREEIQFRLENACKIVGEISEQLHHRGEGSATPRAVLIGPPNSGKSSLFNALAQRFGTASAQPALVSQVAGTTRDYLSARLLLDGVECEIVDTAGAEESFAADSIAANAQQASREQGQRADLLLHCIPATDDPASYSSSGWHIVTKSDMRNCAVEGAICTSAVTGEGLDELAAELARRTKALSAEARTGVVAATSTRCADSLRFALDGLERSRNLVSENAGEELLAAELRDVLHHLGRVVGAVYTDDILDQIFGRFCIGK